MLAFIKRYYVEHGESPTQSEIAAGLGISKQRVQALVRKLDRDGKVRRVSGARRGIMLAGPSKHFTSVDALLALQEEGWRVSVSAMELTPPLPTTSLPLPPQLDHIPAVEIGVGDDGIEQRR